MRYQNENALNDVVDELFSTTTTKELNDELTMLMDNYIRYAPVDRGGLANTASVALQLMNFLKEIKTVSDKIKEKVSHQLVQNASVVSCLFLLCSNFIGFAA